MAMMNRSRVVLVLAVLILVACQSGVAPPAAAPAPAATTATSPAADPADVDVSQLYEAARREGEIALYSSNNIDDIRFVLDRFMARYPGVRVNHVRASSEDLVRRLVTETRGGRTLADVFEANALSFYAVISEDLIEPFFPPEAAGLPAEFKDLDGRWYVDAITYDAIGFNTSLIQRSEVPRTYEQAGDPKYRGQLMMEPSDQIVMLTLWQRKYNGDLNRTRDVFAQVAKNDPLFTRGHSEAADLLASGERPIFAGATTQPLVQIKDKAGPVDWLSEGEVIIVPNTIGLVKNAPRPNAAKLYVNWVLSQEGQQAFADRKRPPARPGMGNTITFAQQYVFSPEMSRYHDQIRAEWQGIFGLR
jgi:iron(III) transport system substrate-binding protein